MGSFLPVRAIQLLPSEQATLADTGHIPSPCVNVLPQWKGAQSSQARSSSLCLTEEESKPARTFGCICGWGGSGCGRGTGSYVP